jgi:hypothetical protein
VPALSRFLSLVAAALVLIATSAPALAHHAPGHEPCDWQGDPVSCHSTYGPWHHDNYCYMTIPQPEPPPTYEGWIGRYPYGHVYWAWCPYQLPWPPRFEAWSGWGSMPGEGDDDKGPLWYGELPSAEDVARELIEAALPTAPPDITLQPLDALINFPTIASTVARDEVTLQLPAPFRGSVTATPAYTWDFGDGAAASGPGRPFDGTSPREHPDYYVAHAYTTLGTKTVTLTETWTVILRVSGEVPAQLEDVVRTTSRSTAVRSAWSELIGG